MKDLGELLENRPYSNSVLDASFIRAKSQVEYYWPTIQIVAAKLLESKVLRGRDVEAMIEANRRTVL
jgi:hypothetical protein